MLTVGNDAAEVERRLSRGRLECPLCGGRLAGWGHARMREVRLAGGTGWRLRPSRAICGGRGGCGRTHVQLPAGMLARRADSAAVIGEALAGAAAGLGHRTIGGRLGVAATTVRGWLRRLASRAEALRSAFTVWRARRMLIRCCLARPGQRWRMRSPRSEPLPRRRRGGGAARHPWYRRGSLPRRSTSGGLLSPGTEVRVIITSCPW